MKNNKYFPLQVFILLLIFTITDLSAQNVGIGTLDPAYKLDIRTRMDTTFQVKNVGIQGLASTTATRVGILNVMDENTDGDRIGILTKIDYPTNPIINDYNYYGSVVEFDGACWEPPLGTCGNDADIFGYKVHIPFFASGGTHYGIYSDVEDGFGYAGYFKGHGYFSDRLGIGALPSSPSQQVYLVGQGYPRLLRLRMINMTEGSSANEGLFISGAGNSSTNNFGAFINMSATAGTAHGMHSEVSGGNPGLSYGALIKNSSTSSGSRYGVRSEVTANGTSAMYGVSTEVSGNGLVNAVAYGLHSVVEEVSSTIGSYALFAHNQNVGISDYAGFFNGRTAIINGVDASYATGAGYLTLGSTTGTNVVLDNNEIMARNNGSSSTLHVQANGGDLLLCNDEFGSVGIGILSPSGIPNGYLLAVDGKGIFEELRVEMSGQWWPDYVFESDYDLRSIDELKSFIDDNGHLPNIPPAAEVESEGILLGDMQRRVMEKIEELTLYIIQQQEEIDQLKKSIPQTPK